MSTHVGQTVSFGFHNIQIHENLYICKCLHDSSRTELIKSFITNSEKKYSIWMKRPKSSYIVNKKNSLLNMTNFSKISVIYNLVVIF